MKVLLTAFEPFGDQKTNASEEALKLVHVSGQTELIRLVLPVVYQKDADPVIEMIGNEEPDVIICTGVAGGRDRISVERIAVNLCDSAHPDNAGNVLTDVPVRKDGPAAYFSTLPVREIVTAVNDAGIPAEVSCSAGTYVCNDLMYRVLDACENRNKKIRAGFIHVPFTPGEAAAYSPVKPSLSSESAAKAIETAIGVITGHIEESNRR